NYPIKTLAPPLSLAPEQVARLESIQNEHRMQMRRIQPGRAPLTPDAAAAMQTLSSQTSRLVQEVLTPSQQAQVLKLQSGFSTLSRLRLPVELFQELRLSPDQVAALGAIVEARDEKMRGIRDRSAADQLQSETRAKALNVLDARQRDLVERYQPARP